MKILQIPLVSALSLTLVTATTNDERPASASRPSQESTLDRYTLKKTVKSNEPGSPIYQTEISGWEEKADRDPELPAKVCFARVNATSTDSLCQDARSTNLSHPWIEKLEVVDLGNATSPHEAVLFVASSHAWGSGAQRLVFLFVPCPAHDRQALCFRNVLPGVVLSEQGEYDLWPLGGPLQKVFVTAEHVWTEHEAHFDPHYYHLTAYLYDESESRLSRLCEYRTATRYPDGTSSILEAERQMLVQLVSESLAGKARH